MAAVGQVLGQALCPLAHQPGQTVFRLDIAFERCLPIPPGSLDEILLRLLAARFQGARHGHLCVFVTDFGKVQLLFEGKFFQRLGGCKGGATQHEDKKRTDKNTIHGTALPGKNTQ